MPHFSNITLYACKASELFVIVRSTSVSFLKSFWTISSSHCLMKYSWYVNSSFCFEKRTRQQILIYFQTAQSPSKCSIKACWDENNPQVRMNSSGNIQLEKSTAVWSPSSSKITEESLRTLILAKEIVQRTGCQLLWHLALFSILRASFSL